MIISKQTAGEIAEKLTAKFKEKHIEAKDKFAVACSELYSKKIPREVLTFFSKHPTYCNKLGYLRLYGNGFSGEGVPFKGSLVGEANTFTIEPTKAEAAILIKLKEKVDNTKKHYDVLLAETTSALLSLRTFARIRENLPEATPFLPSETSTALVPNISKLRSELARKN